MLFDWTDIQQKYSGEHVVKILSKVVNLWHSKDIQMREGDDMWVIFHTRVRMVICVSKLVLEDDLLDMW